MPRHNRRNRERHDRKQLLRAEWWYNGRAVIVVEVTHKGTFVTTRVDKDRVGKVSRELAAEWLREYYPRLTHDERYALIWG